MTLRFPHSTPRMLFAVAALAAMAVVADAASCNMTVVADILTSTDAVTCTGESGYLMTSLAAPTDAEMELMCTSSACQAALAQLQDAEPSECTADTFALYADLITLEADYCAASSGSSVSESGSSSQSTGSESASSSASAASTTDSTVNSSNGGSSTFVLPSITPTGSSSSGDSGGGSTTASPESSTASSNTGTSSTGVNGVTAQPDGSVSGSGSSSSSGLSTTAMIGIIAGAVALLLVLLAVFVARRRRRDRHRRSSREPPVELGSSPVGRKQVRLLDDAAEYDDKKGSTTKTHSTGGGSMEESKAEKSNLWEDPVIVAARISIDRIQLGPLIGRGGFGEVYRAQYRYQDVAVKMLLPEKRKDLEQIQTFLAEIRLIATMDHPFILNFIGVAWESLSDLYCVTEFMAGGDLRSLLNAYQTNEAPQGMDASKVEIAYQVAYALTYLHSLEPVVLHRDLKSRNILLTESFDAKITDFGTSRVRSTETMTAGVGSWMWMAPEVMVGGHYDEKADVFSLGVVLSELDTHEMPYSQAKAAGFSDAALMQKMSMGQLRVSFSRFTDASLSQFAQSCVSLDPRDRPTAAEVLYYFQKARNVQY